MGTDHPKRVLKTPPPSERNPQTKHWLFKILSLSTKLTASQTCGSQNFKFFLFQPYFDAVVELVQALVNLSAD